MVWIFLNLCRVTLFYAIHKARDEKTPMHSLMLLFFHKFKHLSPQWATVGVKRLKQFAMKLSFHVLHNLYNFPLMFSCVVFRKFSWDRCSQSSSLSLSSLFAKIMQEVLVRNNKAYLQSFLLMITDGSHRLPN